MANVAGLSCVQTHMHIHLKLQKDTICIWMIMEQIIHNVKSIKRLILYQNLVIMLTICLLWLCKHLVLRSMSATIQQDFMLLSAGWKQFFLS